MIGSVDILLLLFSVQECCKWSAQNPGKVPDPRYKLKFRPKEKPVKIKKEKKEKELTKKQKEKLEKVNTMRSLLLTQLFYIRELPSVILKLFSYANN